MRLPSENDGPSTHGESASALDRFRPYLRMLARLQLDDALQAKLDESDIVQQTLMEAHQSLADFRGQSDAEKAAWLQKILVRNVADEMRKYRRGKRDVRLEASIQVAMSESSARLERWLASESGTPSQRAIANEQLVALATALMKLPEDQRRAVELHHLQGLPSAMVAKRLDRSEVAVAGLLRRGLKKLRETMREDSVR
ncbi:MAG TPA: sigma-70 family RNA polymerase sigma factor [Lacipirellulaceae bacterium]|nr:sigma-70 family RNA polymerase sigma factor [Lacipirellulaceae bacterium]